MLQDVNQGTGLASNKRTIESGCDEGYSNNPKVSLLTRVLLILPLRRVPGVVNVVSASESSDTSSEHHCMRANWTRQKRVR